MGGISGALGKLAEWSLEHGSKEEWFEQLAAEGHHVEALDLKPTITGLEWVWTAYHELMSCRQIGMEPGPVPWWAFEMYKDRKELSEEEADLLEFCVSAITRRVDKWRDRKQREKKDKAKAHDRANQGSDRRARRRPPRR